MSARVSSQDNAPKSKWSQSPWLGVSLLAALLVLGGARIVIAGFDGKISPLGVATRLAAGTLGVGCLAAAGLMRVRWFGRPGRRKRKSRPVSHAGSAVPEDLQ